MSTTDSSVDGPLSSTGRKSSGNEIVEASTSVYAPYYKMDHPKRGLALIFNHETFSSGLNPRYGTNVDCDNLENSLAGLGFEVKRYQDLTFEAIKARLAKVAGKNHEDNDCLIVAVLTYEKKGRLCARDKSYNADVIWSYFTSDKSPALASKPKIFIVQACNSEIPNANVKQIDDRTSSDSRGAITFRIPIHADILITYSTIPGFYARQYKQKGSWFIRALCSELRDNGTKYNLLTLLTSVCRQVSDKFNKRVEYNNGEGVDYEQEEMPNFTTMLTRLIQFK